MHESFLVFENSTGLAVSALVLASTLHPAAKFASARAVDWPSKGFTCVHHRAISVFSGYVKII